MGDRAAPSQNMSCQWVDRHVETVRSCVYQAVAQLRQTRQSGIFEDISMTYEVANPNVLQPHIPKQWSFEDHYL